jgi:hypothetical protein
MKHMPALLKAGNQTTECTRELQEQIRRRAHDLYAECGRHDGHELDDCCKLSRR